MRGHKKKRDRGVCPGLISRCGYGRATVITGEVHVSQCAGSAESPSAFSTDTLITYRPFGATYVFLPPTVTPSQGTAKKPVLVLFRPTYSASKARCQATPVSASKTSKRRRRT